MFKYDPHATLIRMKTTEEPLMVVYHAPQRAGVLPIRIGIAPVLMLFPEAVGIMGDLDSPEAWRATPPDIEGDCIVLIPEAEILGIMSEAQCDRMFPATPQPPQTAN